MINPIRIREYIARYRAWKKANENNDAFSAYLGQPAPDPAAFGIVTPAELWVVKTHLSQTRQEPE
jgi:hypothetical protein